MGRPHSADKKFSEDFSLLVAFLLVTFSWLFRGFSVALFCLEKQCLGLFRGFFVVFSWLFRGPRFGQNLRVLALDQSSEVCSSKRPPKLEPRSVRPNEVFENLACRSSPE